MRSLIATLSINANQAAVNPCAIVVVLSIAMHESMNEKYAKNMPLGRTR